MLCRIAKAYEEYDMAVLTSNNNGLNTSTCSFSSDLKEVNAIFADTWGQGIYQFAPLQQTRLEELSCRDAAEFGPSVYAARALLGEFMQCNNGFEKTTPVVFENASAEGSALVSDINISVYSNPTEGEAYLLYEIGERQTAEVKMFDIAGKLVAVTPITSNKGVVTLNLSDLESGVYLFQVLS